MVYDQQALSPSITTMGGGGQTASCGGEEMNVPIKCNLKHAEWGGRPQCACKPETTRDLAQEPSFRTVCLCTQEISPTIRGGGHGSMDKHRWDTVVVKVIRDDEIISV